VTGIKELIRDLLKQNNKLYLHTNQSGVSRGYFTIESTILCNEKLINLPVFGKVIFRKICAATELIGSENSYRKLSPKLGLEILNKTKTKRSNLYYIGDKIFSYKAWCKWLTKYVSTNWVDKNVRCNSIYPERVFNNQQENFIQKISKQIPLGRIAKKDEINGRIVYLLSNASSYDNGSLLV